MLCRKLGADYSHLLLGYLCEGLPHQRHEGQLGFVVEIVKIRGVGSDRCQNYTVVVAKVLVDLNHTVDGFSRCQIGDSDFFQLGFIAILIQHMENQSASCGGITLVGHRILHLLVVDQQLPQGNGKITVPQVQGSGVVGKILVGPGIGKNGNLIIFGSGQQGMGKQDGGPAFFTRTHRNLQRAIHYQPALKIGDPIGHLLHRVDGMVGEGNLEFDGFFCYQSAGQINGFTHHQIAGDRNVAAAEVGHPLNVRAADIGLHADIRHQQLAVQHLHIIGFHIAIILRLRQRNGFTPGSVLEEDGLQIAAALGHTAIRGPPLRCGVNDGLLVLVQGDEPIIGTQTLHRLCKESSGSIIRTVNAIQIGFLIPQQALFSVQNTKLHTFVGVLLGSNGGDGTTQIR